MFAIALLLAAFILLIDLAVDENVSIAIVSLVPIMLASAHLNRWQVLLLAVGGAVLRESVAPFAWEPTYTSRLISGMITFAAGGLFACEVSKNRRLILRSLAAIEQEMARRKEAEAQLQTLVESSPAAIITLQPDGTIDLANQAAHALFNVEEGVLTGQHIRDYLPMLERLLHGSANEVSIRTSTSCRGHRASGESFMADVWFSTYQALEGTRMAAIISDSTEEMRDWQQTSLETLLRSTRVLVGSVSHEIRNICAAIRVAHTNLGRIPAVSDSEDYASMTMLTQGLTRLATFELQSSSESDVGTMSLQQVLEEFRIVVDPMLEAASATMQVEVEENLPMVDGDRHGLLQVLLNLTRNSLRALKDRGDARLALKVSLNAEWAMLHFSDNGPGVTAPNRLFQPFQHGAEAVGLGLFVSRAIVRGFGGELYHEATDTGCTMVMRLAVSDREDGSLNVDESELHA